MGYFAVAMPGESTELVRAFYAAFNTPDWPSRVEDLATSLAHPDAEWHTRERFIDAGVFRGLPEIIAFLERFWSEFAQLHVDVEECVALGETVLARIRFQGRGRRSGVEVDQRMTHVWTFRDGQVARVQTYDDWQEAREAAQAVA